MDPKDLYDMAKNYGFDEICLQILRNCNYCDQITIHHHWKGIIENIYNSDNNNKMETIKSKVVALSKEFYNCCIYTLLFVM